MSFPCLTVCAHRLYRNSVAGFPNTLFGPTTLKSFSEAIITRKEQLLFGKILTKLRHSIYMLQGARHARRWRDFSLQNTSVPRFGITLFVHTHPSTTRDEIVDHLMMTGRYGDRESCTVVVARNLRDMETNRQIECSNGRYRALNHVKFVIREEEPWFSWFFVVSVGLAISMFVTAFILGPVQYSIHTGIAIVLFIVIFVKIVDEMLHTTPF